MTDTNNNYDSAQWAAHLAKQAAAARRVTPILRRQRDNDPNKK